MRSGRLLVSLQLALSLPLLVGAGLLARTVYNLQRADLGFPAERLLLVRVDLREAGYDAARRDRVLRELLGQIQRIPGVRAASFSQLGVFSGGESSATIEVEGYAPKGDDDRGSALGRRRPRLLLDAWVSRSRWDAKSWRAISGDAARVCVINEAFAKRFFDRRNPIGMRITLVNDERADGVSGGGRRQKRAHAGPARRRRAALLRAGRAAAVLLEQPDVLDSHGHGNGAGDGGRAEGDPGRGRRRADHLRQVD